MCMPVSMSPNKNKDNVTMEDVFQFLMLLLLPLLLKMLLLPLLHLTVNAN